MNDKKNKNINVDKKQLNDVIGISKRILNIIYVLLIILGAYILIKMVKELQILSIIGTILKILTPLFIGILVAWLFNPFVKWLEKKQVRRVIGTSFAYVLLIVGIFLLIKAIIPLLYNQTIDLVENLPNIFESVKDWVNNIFNKIDSNTINIENIEKNLLIRLDQISSNLATILPSFIINSFSTIISSIGTFLIGLVIGFFLLISYNSFSVSAFEILPKRFRKGTYELLKKINQSLRSYASGALLDAGVVFVVSTIVFAIIGLKAPLLFGLFCGLMNVIPYAGPYIGGAPAVIVGFSQGTGIGIAILIAIVIIQMVEGNVLQTLIISKTTKLHPITIIIGLLIFGHFFGIIGMLLSTPIISVLKVLIKYFDDKYDILNFE